MMNSKNINLILIIFIIILGSKSFQGKAQTTPDPGLAGSYTVLSQEYNLGDLAFSDPSFPNPMEVRGSVHYPSSMAGGPFPVLMLMHGRHETTYQTSNPSNTNSDWPPTSGFESITSFQGYDYLATQMASHGYIVISISTNAINAADAGVADYGMSARAALMQHHLDLWNTWNTAGGAPFGTLFVGKLDMNNIGTMGHSRGGEGVVKEALLNTSLGSPYGIKAVLTLAPVDFLREVLNNVPFMNVAPYCDGDVSDIQGVHYLDDARYSVPSDEAPKHSILFMGADHNFFNTVWTPGLYPAGGSDDWGYNSDPHCGTGPSNKRLTPAEQQAAFNAYASAFFRLYIGHETAFAPILEVDDIVPPVSSLLDSSGVFVSYHAPYSKRLDVNRTTTVSTSTTNTLTGSVTTGGLVSSGICGGGGGETACGVSPIADKEPHKGTSGTPALSQMAMRWNSATDYYQNIIPAANQNFTIYENLQFRASVNFKESTSGADLNFTIQLIDISGNISSQEVGTHTHAMFFQPGTQAWELPKVLFNTIKIPLNTFTGIDMTQVQKIKFLFDKTTAGSILIADLALSGLTPIATS
ncbi:MAG: hypothetical protein NTX97_01665, partial [Bacteroidetes bacterium]|nr:hypothetical protein [Bacteroidota bacterium]